MYQMKKKMNIGLINYDLSRNGGSERVSVNLANGLSRENNVVLISIYCSFPENGTFMLEEEVKLLTLVNDVGSFKKYGIEVIKKLRHVICENNIQVLMSIGLDSALFSCVACMFSSCRTIICEHSNLNNKMYNKWRKNSKRVLSIALADKFITLTEKDMSAYIEKFPLFHSKFDYIYNWINDELMSENSIYNLRSKKIVTVCRIDKVKNLEASIVIAKQVIKKHPEWYWEVYGDGDVEYLSELNEQLKRAQLEDKFIFMGRTNDLNKAYGDAAIYVSTSKFEGLPMALLEAKAYKLPIVSFDCMTGPSDIICDNQDGFLVKLGDIDDAVNSVNILIESDKLRMSFSNETRNNIAKFSKTSVLHKWNTVFNELLCNKRNC